MPLDSREAQEIYMRLGQLAAEVKALQLGVGSLSSLDTEFTEKLAGLTNLVHQLGQRVQTVPLDEFKRNHHYVTALIEEKEAKSKFWLSLQSKVAGAGLLRVAILTGTALWAMSSQYLANLWEFLGK